MRVAATPRDGLGHAKRMIALAAALRGLGAQISAPDLLSPNANPMIRSSAESLGMVPSADDAECVVFDSYELGLAEQELERARGRVVVVVDDAPVRRHSCSLLVDQNQGDDRSHPYQGMVPDEAICLLGPAYALLGPEYRAGRRSGSDPNAPRRVVVNFGGSRQDALEALAVEALNAAGLRPPAWEIVVTGAAPPRPSMRDVWESAGLVVGAAGSSSWERARVGVRSVVVAIAANQEPVGATLAAAGVAHYAGRATDLTRVGLSSVIRSALEESPSVVADRGRRLVDGLGAHRVARAVLAVGHQLRPRRARADDEALILHWRNDADAIADSLTGRPVEVTEHSAWFRARLADDAGTRLFVVERGQEPVGMVRFDRDESTRPWRISYALARSERGRRLATPLICAGLLGLGRDGVGHRVLADVRRTNERSLGAMTRAGFVEQERDAGHVRLSLDA